MDNSHTRISFSWEKFLSLKYSYLLFSILAFFVLMPVFENRYPRLIPLFFLILMLAVIKALGVKKKIFWFLLILGLISVLLQTSAYEFSQFIETDKQNQLIFDLIYRSIMALFFIIVIFLFLKHIFSQDEVTSDILKGGIAIYFLIGILWSDLYGILLRINPGSLSFPGDIKNFSDPIYFSFVTLTTLGYGDILPVSWMARNLVILEATLGPLYLTVLISRLVSMHLSQKIVKNSQNNEKK
jgi:hypothetical protein